MNRLMFSMLAPPLAVCRYGCAGCCAAPIAVFWITGIGAILYGFAGGPAQLAMVSWPTVGLGILLWAIAAVWAMTAIRGVEGDASDPKCEKKASTVCRIVPPSANDSDPLDEANKFQH